MPMSLVTRMRLPWPRYVQVAAEIVPRKAEVASPFRRRRSEGVAARVELADVTLDRIAVKEVLEGRDCRCS